MSASMAVRTRKHPWWVARARLGMALLMAAVPAYFVVEAAGFNARARMMPWVIGVPLLILAVANLAREGRAVAAGEPELQAQPAGAGESARSGASAWAAVGWLTALVVAFYLLGFVYAIPAFLAPFLILYGREPWKVVAGVTLGTWALLYGLFVVALQVQVHEGWLFERFGGY